MPSLKLSNLFRRKQTAPSLRERSAELRGSLSRSATAAAEPRVSTEDRSEADAVLLALAPEWEAARDAYAAASQRSSAISDAADSVEPRPSQDLTASERQRAVQGWRERTGVEDAEGDVDEALDVLAKIEDRIAELPATSLAGLRLKALVAQRNDDIEVEWPDKLGEGLARDLLTLAGGTLDMTPPEDAELLRLGARFDIARARETAANEACNAAQDEADRHMPKRPACLFYRASDAALAVHSHLMMAEALEGRKVHASDIEWLKRKMPMRHEVLRPIRDGERGHRDYPGRKFDIVPHVEAQARAEEIMAAWEAWHTEQMRVHGEYVTEALDDAANTAGDATAAIAHRIAVLPAQSAEGFRVKIRALSHYNSSFFYSTLPDLPDPDQALSHSLWRDVQGEPQQTPAAGEATPDRSAGTDPILAAIAASRRAEAEMEATEAAFGGRLMTDAEQAREDAAERDQRATRAAVWATVPTTAEGRAALARYVVFQLKLTFGPDWRAKMEQEFCGDAVLALIAAIGTDTASRASATLDLRDASINQLARLADHLQSLAFIASTAVNAPMAWDSKRQNLNSIGRLLEAVHVYLDELAERVVVEISARVPTDNIDRDDRLSALVKRQMEVAAAVEDPAIMAEITKAWGG